MNETHETHLAYADLTLPADTNHGLHREASTDYTYEVGRESGEEFSEVHRGAFTVHTSITPVSHATVTYQREKLNGHTGDHPGCSWGDVLLENVLLNRMVRVSDASWQPEICLERPSAASQVASLSSQSPQSPHPPA